MTLIQIQPQDYDPITGEGAPGKRICVSLEDFMHGQNMWVPLSMMRSRFFWSLLGCRSINRYIELYLSDYNKERSHIAVFRRYIRLRCKHDVPFFAAIALRRRYGFNLICSMTRVERGDVKIVHKMIFRKKWNRRKVYREAGVFDWFYTDFPWWLCQDGFKK